VPIDQTGGAADGNNLTTATAFNTATGILTTSRSGLSALTVDIDGRYIDNIAKINDSVTAYYKDGSVVFTDTSRALIAAKSLNAATANSIELDGDQETPGINKVYGTNSSGVKGWKADGGSNIQRSEYIVGEVGSPDDGETEFTDPILINKTIKHLKVLPGQLRCITQRMMKTKALWYYIQTVKATLPC